MAQDVSSLSHQFTRIETSPSTFRKTAVIAGGALVGLSIAILWSARLVDDQIGENVATNMLGHDARTTTVGGGLAGALFAFVVGLAGTFTACNIAAFSAIGPLVQGGTGTGNRLREALKQIGWVSLGLVVVAGLYGGVAAAVGTHIPQLSTSTVGHHVPVRILQSAVVFTLIGLAFVWLGLAAVDVLPDPLRRLAARWPRTRLVVMGALIGGFLIGRPYPLFFKLFQQAVRTHNVLFGAGTFILTAVGNIAVLAVLFLVLSGTTGDRRRRWLAARPHRVAMLTAFALIAGGTFMVIYWGVRLPARFDYGWFPTMPWQ